MVGGFKTRARAMFKPMLNKFKYKRDDSRAMFKAMVDEFKYKDPRALFKAMVNKFKYNRAIRGPCSTPW